MKIHYPLFAVIRLAIVFMLALAVISPISTFAVEFDQTFQQGVQAYTEGRLEEALDAFRRAAKEEPSNGPVHANIASILYQLGRNDDALAEYREAVRLKPDFGGAYASMADLLERMERRGDAVSAYGDALRLMPKDGKIPIRRAIILRQLGRYDEALADVDTALRINEKSGYAHAARGILLLKKNNPITATENFRKALALDPAYLIEAARSGDDELIKTSLDFGAKLNTPGENGLTALMAAIANDRTAAASMIIRLGADVNARAADGFTALILAAGRGQGNTTELLYRQGADIHAKRNNGGTALMSAAARGYSKIIANLIGRGIDVNAKDTRGGTALMIASERKHAEAVKILLKGKADVNAADTRGNTALIFAAYFGGKEAAVALIDGGASVDALNHEGWTPLMSAVAGKHQSIVELLISHGANIAIKNRSGLTAAALAGMRGDEAIFNILRKAGANESFDFTKQEAFVFGKLIFIEDGEEVTAYSIFNRPIPELFHADTGKIINRIQLAGLLKEAINEDGSFCWQIKRGNYLINRINRFGALRADHFVYPQTAFFVPYGADAYYIGTLKIRITVKRNFIGERSIAKVHSVEVADESNRSQPLITSIKPDFSGTIAKSLMIQSSSLPKTVQSTSPGLIKTLQILNAFTMPLLMMR